MDIENGNLKILFQKIPYTYINENNLKKPRKHNYYKVDKELYLKQASNIFPQYSKDEHEHNYYLLEQDIKDKYTDNKNVFQYVISVSDKLLVYDGNEVLCKFDQLLRWREISFQFGQDFFVCAFRAAKDINYDNRTKFFAWRPIIRSDNNRLHNILNRGMAENHFHLGGSTKIFELNWICLMNLIEGRRHDFKKIERGLQEYYSDRLDMEERKEELYVECEKAALIRVYLFVCLKNNEFVKGVAKKLLKREKMIESNIAKIQDLIVMCKTRFGASIKGEGILDYALEKNMMDCNDNECRILAGERRFLYDCYRAILEDKFDDKQKNYFYKYLCIRTHFRGEMIQINKRVGFTNFQQYQRRKQYFIQGEKPYEKELVRLALNESLNKDNIVSLEVRICPGKTSLEMEKEFYNFNSIVEEVEDEEKQKKLFYVLHFPKIKDKDFCPGMPRNYNARRAAESGMKSVVAFFERNAKFNDGVRGIDTCASELDCRPEVYAQIYRYLSDIIVQDKNGGVLESGNQKRKLKMTYHAGEDFLDLTDGLRAIDEVIRFCGLHRGSRIGHALALGLNPYKYYEYKNWEVILTKQILLDDLAWILNQAKAIGCMTDYELKMKLESQFHTLYNEIYENNITSEYQVSIRDYYCSWKLRGDNPELYRLSEKEFLQRMRYPEKTMSKYQRYEFNSYNEDEINVIRRNKNIRNLYFAYHYNKNVRKKGEERIRFKVDCKYAELIFQVQNNMIRKFVDEGIAIETNPSSNYLIGTIKKYDEHPIFRFNSRKLKKVEPNMQLSVSINTDDQGVFDTLLENEYALMALALKKKKDKNNNKIYDIEDIYEWIDYVRKMGIEQSFKSDIRN